MQDTGNNVSNNPLIFFEKSIRSIEESLGPTPDLKIDGLLGFSESETDRLFDALQKSYPNGHWAVERSNFRYVIEQAMQLLSAGLCRIGTSDREGSHPLDCCARVVNTPTLSPYIRKSERYIIIPTGFISALEKFISSTYAMAAIAASQHDQAKETFLWDQDIFLGSIASLADTNIFTFTRGVMEASLESAMQPVLEDFSDPLPFVAFDRSIQNDMMDEMPFASSWKKLGYKHLSEALEKHQEIKNYATKIARLSVCFTVCHEFGHAFTYSIDAEGAQELTANETFTDMVGSLILNRLIEANVISTIIGSTVTYRDLGNALASFHAWNLSKELGALLKEPKAVNTEDILGRIHEVAVRWGQAVELIRKVWIDDVPALAHVEEKVTTGFMITNHWGIMIAGMLRFVLLKKGHNTDMETACKILPLLIDRNSALYNYLGG